MMLAGAGTGSGLIGQNVVMGVVLVSLPGGAGVVRSHDGATVVTDDVSDGGGTHVCQEDPYHPAKSWIDRIALSWVVCCRPAR
jgi:hypothetical protein